MFSLSGFYLKPLLSSKRASGLSVEVKSNSYQFHGAAFGQIVAHRDNSFVTSFFLLGFDLIFNSVRPNTCDQLEIYYVANL